MTITPSREFEVVAPLFAIGQAGNTLTESVATWLSGIGTGGRFSFSFQGSPFEAFEDVIAALGDQLDALGADATVGTRFEYRVALDSASNQVFEVFAYGSAVRWAEPGRGEPLGKTIPLSNLYL